MFGFILAHWAVIAAGVSVASNIAGRAIPDTATGTLGVVRKVAKVAGLYVANNPGKPGLKGVVA